MCAIYECVRGPHEVLLPLVGHPYSPQSFTLVLLGIRHIFIELNTRNTSDISSPVLICVP